MTTGLATDFVGRRGPLFRLALRTGVLTVFTLGVYRFWMKTRLRRYYWSSVRPGGHPLEYVGDPLEKLLGFLIAVVIMAFYIGVVNLILMFVSFAVLHGNVTAYALSFAGVIPIWFFALYRARRYVLARTRWRGLRFGLDPGAWGYAWRALVHWSVTILSLGLLWPRMTFWLEKYRTDRTWLGNFPLRQGGDWRMLYRAFLPALITGAVLLPSAGLLAAGLHAELAIFGILAGVVAIQPAAVYYRVHSRRLLADNKTAGPLGLVARPRVGRVLGIYVLGYGVVLVVAVVLGVALGAIVLAAVGMQIFEGDVPEVPLWLSTAAGVSLYFALFLSWSALRHAFVTLPLWRHYAETLTVTGAEDLSALSQRERDAHPEAEGFAEALDLGAAI